MPRLSKKEREKLEQQIRENLAPREIRAAWNDGYSAAVSNAQDAGLITEDEAAKKRTELLSRIK